MAFPGGNFPPDGELIEFETEEEPKWITVKLKDGSILQIKMEIVSILRNGNDPNTGIPNYMIQATNIIRLVKVPKELIVKPKKSNEGGQPLYR
ncbi:hypothetical protein [Thermoplasma volcanium]|uniref:hypothetical protein n=1 Tax=Thermoplasma volcanium TaxID=50339 RepID=UPI0000164E24|nr:hypothetical protein [Thermoplasma volcanium]